MPTNQLFSVAFLLASAFFATSVSAQSSTRGGYSSPVIAPDAFRSSPVPSNVYQGSVVNPSPAMTGTSYIQGQTCANGRCAMRTSVPQIAPAMTVSPVVSYPSYPVVTRSVQPIHSVYYPARSSVIYPPNVAGYGSAQSYPSSRVYYGPASCH